MQLQCVGLRADGPHEGALLQHCPKPRGRPRGRPRLNRDQTGPPAPKPEPGPETGPETGPREDCAGTERKTWTRTRQIRPSKRYEDYELHDSPDRKKRRGAGPEERGGARAESHDDGHTVMKTATEEKRNGHDPNWTPINSAAQNSVSHDAAVRVKQEEGAEPVCVRGVVCDVCGKVLRNKSSLSRHSLVHNGARPYGCKYCALRFNRKDNLRNHLRLMHPDGPAPRVKLRPSALWLCHTCGKTFSCRSRLKTHEEIHSGVKPCKCSLCPKAYMRLNDLKHHMKTVHLNGSVAPPTAPPLLCHLCGRSFSCKSLLSLHLTQSHAGERPFTCRLCGRKFSRKHQLTVHSATVHRGQELQPIANSATVKQGEELQPTVRHGGELQPTVRHGEELQPTVRHGEELQPTVRHGEELQEGESAQEGDSLVCDTCGRRLKSAALLESHMAVHSGLRPFQCEICGRSFMSEQRLKKHQLHIHLNPRPARRASGHAPSRPCSYHCAACGRSFRFRSLLLAHAAVHSEDRPFSCQICPRSFRRRSHLTRHVEALHPDGLPKPRHQCPVCGLDQRFSSKLQRHLLTHSGERPHCCDRCPQTFARLGNLQQHQRRIHGDRIPRRRGGDDCDTPQRAAFSDEDRDRDRDGDRDEDRDEDRDPAKSPRIRDGLELKPEQTPEGERGGATEEEGGANDGDDAALIERMIEGEHNYGETRRGAGPEGAGPEEAGLQLLEVSEEQVVMVSSACELLVAQEVQVLVEEVELL